MLHNPPGDGSCGEDQIMLLSSIAYLLCSANGKDLPDIVDNNVRDHMKTIDFDKMQQGSPTVSKELLTFNLSHLNSL